MEVVVVILLMVMLILGIRQNHKNAARAWEGVQFELTAAPSAVREAMVDAYTRGAKAKARAMASGVRLTPITDGLRYETKTGDEGQVSVRSRSGSGSIVQARATDLYVGHPTIHRNRRGLWGAAVAISHGIFKLLRIAPNAVKVTRFHAGLEKRLVKHLARLSQAA